MAELVNDSCPKVVPICFRKRDKKEALGLIEFLDNFVGFARPCDGKNYSLIHVTAS